MMKQKKIESKRGWFFFGIGGDIYLWHIAIGRLDITWEPKRKKRR